MCVSARSVAPRCWWAKRNAASFMRALRSGSPDDLPHRLDGGHRVFDAYCRACADGIVRRLRKVECVRSDDYRHPHAACFDEVVAAKRQQTAADESDIARRVIHRHFAHRISQHDSRGPGAAGRCTPVFQCRAPQHTTAARLDQARNVVEALWMPRHQDHECFAERCFVAPGQGVEEHRFLAIARGREEQDLAVTRSGAERSTAFDQRRIGREVELEIADDHDLLGADFVHALGIGLRLRQHLREASRRLAHQFLQPLRLRSRARRQARVDQHHWKTGRSRFSQQIRPGLGFHAQAHDRRIGTKQASHRKRHVVGQVDL